MRRLYGRWLHDETPKSLTMTIRKTPGVSLPKVHMQGAA
jgi:hypothetical protein